MAFMRCSLPHEERTVYIEWLGIEFGIVCSADEVVDGDVEVVRNFD